MEHTYLWSSYLFTADTSVTPQSSVKTALNEHHIFNLLSDTVSQYLLRTWLLRHMSRDLLRGVPAGSPSATEVNNWGHLTI